MKNIFILESILFYLKQAQGLKYIWIKFKSTSLIHRIIWILTKYNLISGYVLKENNIYIFLRYVDTIPMIKRYKIYSTPTKTTLITSLDLNLKRKQNPQCFFFVKSLKTITLYKNNNNKAINLLFLSIN